MNLIRWLFSYASVTNLCSLVLDRYIAVVKPLKYITFMTRRRIMQMISFSWAIAVAIDILDIASLFFSTPLISSISNWLAMFTEFLACLTVIFCFTNMVHVVYRHDRSARTLAKQLRFNHHVLFNGNDKSAVVMMGIVVGLFLICYGMYLRCSIIELISNDLKSCNDSEYKIPILVLNSAVNPLSYALFKKDIKKHFKRLICTAISKKGNKVKPVNENNHVALVKHGASL